MGIGFLALAKAKNVLKGYTSPKPFDISESDKCIAYDIQIVDHWLSHLRDYTHGRTSVTGKAVLELGPGSDLGAGIYLLSKGCLQYNACDVNDLVRSTPDEFYHQLFEKLKSMDGQADIEFLEEQLEAAKAGNSSRLNYVVRNDFDVASAFGEAEIDLVFSQAAFEHFDDIDATVSQLSAVCKPGAVMVVEIDLKTHSRWIRDKDPNNIYRYSNYVYDMFRFRGIPNRVRPFQYQEALERCGWTDVTITPLVEINRHQAGYSGMNKIFSDKRNQMNSLSIMLCARKAATF